MNSTASRDMPLWVMGASRLIGHADADRRAGDALAWLEARCADVKAKGERAACRALIAGAEPNMRPQSTALILARALADNGMRVILVDLSQGALALSGFLELPRSPGFAELCQQKAGFENVIRRDPSGGLHYLAPGKPRSLGEGWGAPGIMDKVLRALDETYAMTLICAEHAEAAFLSRTMMRPFAAGVLLHARTRLRRLGPASQDLVDFAAFGFPIHWLEEPAGRRVSSL
jgi:hypothetical protein